MNIEVETERWASSWLRFVRRRIWFSQPRLPDLGRSQVDSATATLREARWRLWFPQSQPPAKGEVTLAAAELREARRRVWLARPRVPGSRKLEQAASNLRECTGSLAVAIERLGVDSTPAVKFARTLSQCADPKSWAAIDAAQIDLDILLLRITYREIAALPRDEGNAKVKDMNANDRRVQERHAIIREKFGGLEWRGRTQEWVAGELGVSARHFRKDLEKLGFNWRA